MGPAREADHQAAAVTGWWCRHCDQVVTVNQRSGHAVHTRTALEQCADGEHVVAPTQTSPEHRAQAKAFMADYPGWSAAWFITHFRAWTDGPLPQVAEASDIGLLRTAVDARTAPWPGADEAGSA